MKLFEANATGYNIRAGHDAAAAANARAAREAADPLKMYAIMSLEAYALMEKVRGKVGPQWGHAYMHAFWDAESRPEFARAAALYKASERAFKIGLAVKTTDELTAIFAAHQGICGRTLVTDAAHTVFDQPTITLVGLGPVRRSRLVAGVGEMRPWA